ncbi:MAG: DUF502 domain-containing protein [Cyanobacteria bacterium P01_A01_bin.105]
MLKDVKQDLKNDLIAGLLVVIPLATTIWLTFTVAVWVIRFLTRFPKQLNPFTGFHPVLVVLLNLTVGFAVPLLAILLIGLMARNIAGRWLLDVGEKILQSIPLAGAVYKTLQQLLQTLLQDSKSRFRRVVMVEYPRQGLWAVAFVTGPVMQPNLWEESAEGDAEEGAVLPGHAQNPDAQNPDAQNPDAQNPQQRHRDAASAGDGMLSVFIPTTPNPTSGWYAVVSERDVVNLSISIEEAFRGLLSGGIVGPNLAEAIVNRHVPETVSVLSTAPVAEASPVAAPESSGEAQAGYSAEGSAAPEREDSQRVAPAAHRASPTEAMT